MKIFFKTYCIAFACLFLAGNAVAQTEDDFLPQIEILAMDSTEHAVVRFCNKVVNAAMPGYRKAFVDREDIMRSVYVYDDGGFESVKFTFSFTLKEAMRADSTMGKKRVVKMQRITAELSVMANIYNYLFNTSHTAEKIMAISRNDKEVGYNGSAYTCTLYSDDYKPGYWVLTIHKLRQY